MSNGKSKNNKIQKGRVIALLTREEVEFLEKLSMDALFSTGHKISRIDIISALVDAAMELNLSAKDIRSKSELVRRIVELAKMHQERRRYPRFKNDLVVGLRRLDSLKQYRNGSTDNIGLGGFKVDMAFISESFSIGQLVEITIREHQEANKPIKAFGRIVWMNEKEDASGYEIGIMLTYIRSEDRERYMKYLNKEEIDIKPGDLK